MNSGVLLMILQQNRNCGLGPKLPWWAILLVVLGSLAFGGLVGLAIWFLFAG